MAVVAADLKAYGAANMPEDDTATVGGAVAAAAKVEILAMAANDTLEMVSDNAGDTTQTVTVTGRNAAGAIISDVQTLNGTSVVTFTGTFERVLKIVMSATATGIITVRRVTGGASVGTLEVGFTSNRRHFYDSASEVGSTTRYEKHFRRNDNGSSTLNNAVIELTADPGTSIRIGGAPSKDDSATATNRKTAPASVTFVDDSVTQAVPTDSLAAGEAIGVWIEMVRGAGAAAIKDAFTVDLAGTSA